MLTCSEILSFQSGKFALFFLLNAKSFYVKHCGGPLTGRPTHAPTHTNYAVLPTLSDELTLLCSQLAQV